MIKFPPFLQPSDKVGIVAPASKIPFSFLEHAQSLLSSWGLEVVLSNNSKKSHFDFAGKDADRHAALQDLLDNDDIRCIFCARGGYGTSRIIDQLDLSRFEHSPKWVIGFSDITILLNLLLNHQTASIHGPMPINFLEEKSEESLHILKQLLFTGKYPEIKFESSIRNQPGSASGKIVGGNLTMLTNSIGTKTNINTEACILFLEDIDEKMYRIDRMLVQLKRSGMLDKIKGLIVGHFTRIGEERRFGRSVNELILSHTKDYDFPICFGAPFGHVMPNHPVVIGKNMKLRVESAITTLSSEEDPGYQA